MGLTLEILHNLVRHPVFTVTCKRVALFLLDVNHRTWRWCHLPCPVRLLLFCSYLGLPVLNKQFSKAELLSWTERVGDKFPAWKASLMNMAGRVTWVRFVLSTIPNYLLIAIKVPKWFIRSIHKFRRAFAWQGQKQVNGGSCLVAWDKMQQPLDYGGLGILNMVFMGWALQI